MARRPDLPVQRRVTAYLASTMAEKRLAGEARLPPIRTLATAAGVSYPTMQRAIACLAQQGVLVSRQGSGVTIRALMASRQAKPVAPPRMDPRGLQRRIATQVLAGQWSGDEPFPSPKELRARFGVSHRTIAAALAGLVSGGWLERWGRGYRVVAPATTSGTRVVALVLRGGPDGEVVYPSERTEDDLRSLEIQCTRLRARLALVTADPIGGRWAFPGGTDWVLHRPTSAPGVLGHIVWTSSIGGAMLAELAPMVRAAGCPVAALHEGTPDPALPGGWPRLTRHFVVAHSPHSGRAVGQLLLRLGHRRLGWLSVSGDAYWSQVRLAGLRGVYAAAGMPDAVTEFPYRAPVPEENPNTQASALSTALRQASAAGRDEVLGSVIRTLDANAETIRVMLGRGRRHRGYLPLLEAALSESERCRCTAWVAEADDIAIAAVQFLRERGVRVPQDISVVGFDNGRPASEHGLTSYAFNGPAYMHAMLRWVLGAAPSLRPRQREPVQFEGFVVERATTGRVR